MRSHLNSIKNSKLTARNIVPCSCELRQISLSYLLCKSAQFSLQFTVIVLFFDLAGTKFRYHFRPMIALKLALYTSEKLRFHD